MADKTTTVEATLSLLRVSREISLGLLHVYTFTTFPFLLRPTDAECFDESPSFGTSSIEWSWIVYYSIYLSTGIGDIIVPLSHGRSMCIHSYCSCGVRCRVLATCLLYLSPLFEKLILNNSCSVIDIRRKSKFYTTHTDIDPWVISTPVSLLEICPYLSPFWVYFFLFPEWNFRPWMMCWGPSFRLDCKCSICFSEFQAYKLRLKRHILTKFPEKYSVLYQMPECMQMINQNDFVP